MTGDTPKGRLVGLDFGTRRVGLALADPLRIFAQPYGTFSPAEAVAELIRLHASDPLEAIIIGWPLDEEGREGKATERVEEYERRLRKRLPGVAIERMDERYTSEEAKDRLGAGKRDKGRVDQLAAGIILQEYLDTKRDG